MVQKFWRIFISFAQNGRKKIRWFLNAFEPKKKKKFIQAKMIDKKKGGRRGRRSAKEGAVAELKKKKKGKKFRENFADRIKNTEIHLAFPAVAWYIPAYQRCSSSLDVATAHRYFPLKKQNNSLINRPQRISRKISKEDFLGNFQKFKTNFIWKLLFKIIFVLKIFKFCPPIQ